MNLNSLSLAMRLLREAISQQVRASQVEMLLIIADMPGLTQNEIAGRTNTSTSTVSKAVDVFSDTGRRDGKGGAAGLVETRPDPADRRSRLVYLTEKGQAFLYQLQNL